jgi:hypothetical protein
MTNFDIATRRLANQSIAPAELTTPAEVVHRLGAVQAQDYASALWAIGLRAEAATQQSIEQAISNKEIVRTWPMRGTLHLVTAVDVRWLLALLTPRILANAARRHQQLELDEAAFVRAEALFVSALEGGCQLTRSQMMDVLEKAGIATTGQRGYHILWRAAQTGLICFGPRRGKEDTFVLLRQPFPESERVIGRTVPALLHRSGSGHVAGFWLVVGFARGRRPRRVGHGQSRVGWGGDKRPYLLVFSFGFTQNQFSHRPPATGF